jgi:hypothetical protein
MEMMLSAQTWASRLNQIPPILSVAKMGPLVAVAVAVVVIMSKVLYTAAEI